MERADPTTPETWTMPKPETQDIEQRCLAGLRAQGIPATRVRLDPAHLKGGYICDTMRIEILYEKSSPKAATTKRSGVVSERPRTAILKIASPASADHDVAMRLRLYEREWHFYEKLAIRVPVRVPKWLGSVKDAETGLITEGVLLEDLCIPGAVLSPKMDDAMILTTISHIAKHHAAFWNAPELTSGALGIKPHNSPWYQPGWGDDIAAYWPRFKAKWEVPDAKRNRELPKEAFYAGELIAKNFAYVQDELSRKPHCFNHGDVKAPNMFMMSNNTPAFIDWQYTAVGKGCQDVLFFLVEGKDIEECRRLEPIAMQHYHASLIAQGITDYTWESLLRDWKLACMHMPFYVAMWFGTTPDDALVDADFPRRFVPRAFDAILRNGAHLLLTDAPSASPSVAEMETKDLSSEALLLELNQVKTALARMTDERNALAAALKAIRMQVESVNV